MKIKPYGDTTGDGKVQVSFTLPLADGPEAVEAARRLAGMMGLDRPLVAHHQDMGIGYTFFVIYGSLTHQVDTDDLEVAQADFDHLSLDEVGRLVHEEVGRPITVVGACTGTDSHTVGLDAIMNRKGFHGHYGLESLPEFNTYNLGSQVPNEVLVAKAIEVGADAILVSKVVTQKNIHVTDLTELVDMLEAEGLRDRVILVCGGPRLSHELAVELGFDAGFGPGTVASEVASFLAQEMVRRHPGAEGRQ
ncbi:MAG: lysine 5,6-aminomutase subunit beta [Symbiobacteriia bacterium]